MRIVVPFTRITPGVLEALDATFWAYETVGMTAEDSYWQLLADLWASGEDFAIVEHDVTVRPTVFDEFNACLQPWCVFPHRYVCGTYFGLGCVRFRADLTARVPDLMERMGRLADEKHPPKHWCTLDKWFQELLPAAGEHMHHHFPVLEHAGTEPAHGCL